METVGRTPEKYTIEDYFSIINKYRPKPFKAKIIHDNEYIIKIRRKRGMVYKLVIKGKHYGTFESLFEVKKQRDKIFNPHIKYVQQREVSK